MRRVAETLGIFAALILLGLGSWSGPPPFEEAITPPDPPGWAEHADVLLDGFDAGHWAEQVLAWQAGRRSRLESLRAPTWTLLTIGTQAVTGEDVARAGHLINHLQRLVLGPLAWIAARGLGLDRLVATLAAAAVMLHPEMRFNAITFGVDMTVSTAWVALLAVTLHIDGRAWRAALAGVVTALVFAAHITTMPCLIPAAWLVLRASRGKPWPLLAWAATTYGTAQLIYSTLPALTKDALSRAMIVGVVDQAKHLDTSLSARLMRVLAAAERRAPTEFADWLHGHFGGLWPAAVVAGLVLLGGLGFSVGARAPQLGGFARRLPRPIRLSVSTLTRGLGAGLPTLALLTPVPLLFIVGASERYANTLVPVLVLLAVRGASGVGAWVDEHLPTRWPKVATQVVPLLLVAPGLGGWDVPFRGDRVRDDTIWAAASQIAARWPGSEVATTMKEISASAGALSCPDTPCPSRYSRDTLASCLQELRVSCHGPLDTFPYVIHETSPLDDRPPERKAMDDYMRTLGTPVITEESSTLSIYVLSIPRASEAPPAVE